MGRAQAVVQHRHYRRILGARASAQLFELLVEPNRQFRASFVRWAVHYAASGSCSGKARPYLNIGHTGLDSEAFRLWVRTSEVQPIYFVHDLIPITHPQYCRAGETDRHRARMLTVLTTGNGVIANSHATLTDLEHFAREEGLALPPAVAAWLGTSLPSVEPFGQPVRPRLTFVALGTIEARKNHALLLRIWGRLAEQLGPDLPQLVVIGQRGWEATDVFEMLDRDKRLRGNVVETVARSDAELLGYLKSARALLFPSYAEGYGLPLTEALSIGLPVIASDLPAFREIGQGVPLFIDADDEAAWEAAILDFARPESGGRSTQLKRLQHYRRPDWAQHFQTVEGWLRTRRCSEVGQS